MDRQEESFSFADTTKADPNELNKLLPFPSSVLAEHKQQIYQQQHFSETVPPELYRQQDYNHPSSFSDPSHAQNLGNNDNEEDLKPIPDLILFRLRCQCEYYFSIDNLIHDDYLMQHLLTFPGNSVPCDVVGNFPRIRAILDGNAATHQVLYLALMYSGVVRVLGNMLVPVNANILQQALYIRNTNSQCFHPMHHGASLASSRYSPATIPTCATDDTTDYSSIATGIAAAGKELADNQNDFAPQLWSVPSHPDPYSQFYGPPRVYAPSVDDDLSQVPYGYTVTTAAIVSPVDDSNRRNKGRKKKTRANKVNQDTDNSQQQKQAARAKKNKQRQGNNKDHKQNSELDHGETETMSKCPATNQQERHKNNRLKDNRPIAETTLHRTKEGIVRNGCKNSNFKRHPQRRRQRQQQKSASENWTSDDFPALDENYARRNEKEAQESFKDQQGNNGNHEFVKKEGEMLLSRLKGLSLQAEEAL